LKLNQRRKNITLLGILLGLIVLTGALAYWDPRVSGTDLDEMRFTVDTTPDLNQITLRIADQIIDLKKQNGSWQLNEQYQADPYLIELMTSLLNRIRVDRPVAQDNLPAVMELMDSSGVKVDLSFNDLAKRSFKVGGRSGPTLNLFYGSRLSTFPGQDTWLQRLFGRNICAESKSMA